MDVRGSAHFPENSNLTPPPGRVIIAPATSGKTPCNWTRMKRIFTGMTAASTKPGMGFSLLSFNANVERAAC